MKWFAEKRAYWIKHTHLFRMDEYECSACGGVSCKAYSSCPSCGARMRSSEYDPSWVDEAEGLSAMMDDDW